MGIILRYKDLLSTYKTRSHRIKHLDNYKFLFPLKSSPMLAGIVADLIGDGHLQGNPKWRIDYTSKSIEELKRFESEMNHLFNVNGKVRKCTTNKLSNSYNIGINNSPISRVLSLIGVPTGQKVLTEFTIPKWISSDKECFRIFARRLFTCEGSIMHEKNRKIPQVRLNMWKSKEVSPNQMLFLNDLSEHLNKFFSIKSTTIKDKAFNIRKDKIETSSFTMYICNTNVLEFNEEIGFDGEKQIKLSDLCCRDYNKPY